MKKLMLKALLPLLCLNVCTAWGQTSTNSNEFSQQKGTPGYEIIRDIPVQRSKSPQAKPYMKIKSGRVCMPDNYFKGYYCFNMVDVGDYLKLGQDYVIYLEPNQDPEYTPKRYVKRSDFNKSARKVTIYGEAPSSWKVGQLVYLQSKQEESEIKGIIVRPVQIKDEEAVYVEREYKDMPEEYNSGRTNWEDYVIEKRTSLYNKIVYEIKIFRPDNIFITYVYNDREMSPKDNDKGHLENMKVNASDYFSATLDGKSVPCKETEPYNDGYPNISTYGWLSPTKMVINDTVFEVIE